MNRDSKQIEFLELLKPIHDDLAKFARALTRNRDDAKDLVNDTLLKAYESFEKIKQKDSFKAYLFSIASRIHKRKIWRAKLFGSYDETNTNNLISDNTSADTKIDIQILYKALDKLPTAQKEAIILFEISGFSLEEIRNIQGGTLSGVKSRLKRGREKLSEILNDNNLKMQLVSNTNHSAYKNLNGTVSFNDKLLQLGVKNE
jgi:RNA polymerase sigma-70 factor (ECF subfamily)